jgi:hypothetical protein
MIGKTSWYFPDGDLPKPVPGDQFVSHESLMILNPNQDTATVEITLYWEDQPPTAAGTFQVEGLRVRCIRMDRLPQSGGPAIPYRTQYAIHLASDVGVYVQYGRLDTAQPNFTLVGVQGFADS